MAAIVALLVLFTSLSAVSHGVARHWVRPIEDQACQPVLQSLQADGSSAANLSISCGPPALPRFDGAATVTATIVLFVVSFFFGLSLPFVNLSSLSQFYSARLSRTYIGASNRERQKGAGVNLTEEVPGDDLAIDKYLPHEHGGPLHLINVTLNETVGGQSQIEDRDRKGLALAVGPSGVSVGVTQHAMWKHEGETSRLEEIEPLGRASGHRNRRSASGRAIRHFPDASRFRSGRRSRARPSRRAWALKRAWRSACSSASRTFGSATGGTAACIPPSRAARSPS